MKHQRLRLLNSIATIQNIPWIPHDDKLWAELEKAVDAFKSGMAAKEQLDGATLYRNYDPTHPHLRKDLILYDDGKEEVIATPRPWPQITVRAV